MWLAKKEELSLERRSPGISGFMRLRNEEEFLDRAIESHLDGLDELIIVFNRCEDSTPEICYNWQRKYPEKIKVFSYEPVVYPVGTIESRTVDPNSENSLANYYNYALVQTTKKIVIKIDGDHIAVSDRWNSICNTVRSTLRENERYPVYGLNLAMTDSGVGIYNLYNFNRDFSVDRSQKIGPPPFTSGDHCFYFADDRTWHGMDPIEGYEVMELGHKVRSRLANFTYVFFHMKGMKADFGTSNWKSIGSDQIREKWIEKIARIQPSDLASFDEMKFHCVDYFMGADVRSEFMREFGDMKIFERSQKIEGLADIKLAAKNFIKTVLR